MEVAVVKCLKRVRKEIPRRLTELRETCDKLIDSLSSGQVDAKNDPAQDNCADRYIGPFQAACESRVPKLVEVGLDSIHYLIEHGYFTGKTKVISRSSAEPKAFAGDEAGDGVGDGECRQTMMDVLVETINQCAEDFDEGVQLQVIKALLVAVTSPSCEVHEASLLLAVRACFHIHLITKNQVNKTTAKAALTQMLSAVYQKMESIDAKMKLGLIVSAEGNVDGARIINSSSSTEDPNLSTSNVVGQEKGDRDTDVDSANEDPKDVGANVNDQGGGDREKDGKGSEFPSIMHKDAFLLFRALCKLSMKGLHDHEDTHVAPSDPIALQNKLLSLELILHTLQMSGPAFRSGERYIYAIRNYLCVSLLGNCTSPVAQVVGLSLQIFIVLLDVFKDHLKAEVEVFMSTIFLRILESENSTYEHKIRVLDVFHRICRDSSAMVEIFINYDCDMEAIDMFRRIVDGFAKVVKNANSSIPQSRAGASSIDFISSSATKRAHLEEQQQLRVTGLKGLVALLQSLLRSGGFTDGLPADSLANVDVSGIDTQLGSSHLRIVTSVPVRVTEGSSPVSDSQLSSSARDSNETDSIHIDTTNIVDNFDRKQRVQEDFEIGILKFNLSPKKGLAFLCEKGHLELSPEGVAQFLHQYQDRLDKTAVGEYLGREREYEEGFCLKVLHEYVNLMDFSAMPFDLAIRHFLSGFRLPGEAQKIDRLMEKFAERYYLQNSDVFASADMAFILAFSTIMLQTNLHNPAIREDKRMTKEQFIRQNKGISSDGELSDEMLIEIYDRIAAEPISINQDDKSRRPKKSEGSDAMQFNMFQVSADKRRKEAFNDERKEMVRHGEALFRQASKKTNNSIFVRNSARGGEPYVRPMFEVIWAPVVAVLSQVLETADDQDEAVVDICLAGIYCAIRLACRTECSTARHTLINTLSKFTTLDTVREMHRKHISCIKLVLEIAFSEADYLDESWILVLQCISQIARLQLFANKLLTDDAFFGDNDSSNGQKYSGGKRILAMAATISNNRHHGQTTSMMSTESFAKFFSGPSRAETARHTEETNAALLMREINPMLLDKLFLNSSSLNGESVCHFVRCLCEVSMLEISSCAGPSNLRAKDISCDTANPRIFSLQKLVEVADVNMSCRPRVQWSNMWGVLADYFAVVGVNDNLGLAMFALDALKQLSIKFLQKDELSNFNFQRIFLKPFEVILSGTKLLEIKDMVLRIIDVLVKTSASNIRSGWRSIFKIFEASAKEPLEIAQVGFLILQKLFETQIGLIEHDFVDLTTCLVSFVACRHTDLSISALHDLATCADRLADGVIQPAHDHVRVSKLRISEGDQNSHSTDRSAQHQQFSDHCDGDSEETVIFRVWWPLLLGLSSHVSDSRLAVRTTALDGLATVLRKHAGKFSSETWSVIFKGILFPVIESVKADTISSNDESGLDWTETTCNSVLTICCEIYRLLDSFGMTCTNIFHDLAANFENIVYESNEKLARIGIEALRSLTQSPNICQDTVVTEITCSTMNHIVSRIMHFKYNEECELHLSKLDWCDMNEIGLADWSVYQALKEKYLSEAENGNSVSTPSLGGDVNGLVVEGADIDTFITVSLMAGEIASDLIHRLNGSVCETMVMKVIEAVEAQYLYAISFNDDRRFCINLTRYFSNRHSHESGNKIVGDSSDSRIGGLTASDSVLDLVDLEIQSVTTLAGLVTADERETNAQLREMLRPSFSRTCAMACVRFVRLENKLPSVSASDIIKKLLIRYAPVVKSVLETILAFSPNEFRCHEKWIVPLLSRLIMSEDATIRGLVSHIYTEHINPRFLSSN